ncbi:MAG: UDP-glucose 4-epimerase GalE [Myxococcota bacterium]|nr:UDP-glucose 4-epimerase GalE [Myxococcota bacterium]
MKTPILVTGGAGYIGSNTCHALAQAGFRPVIVDDLSKGHARFAAPFELHVLDITDEPKLSELMLHLQPAAVIHFAAFTEVSGSMRAPVDYYRVNVQGTVSLLRAMLAAKVKKLVFSSSAATYGTPIHVPIREDHPTVPINPYGRTKLMMEQMMADCRAAYDLDWIALRYFNAAGANPALDCGEWHEPETHLIPNILRAARGDIPALELYGTTHPTPDGTAVRDYIHVSDLADAHVRALRLVLEGGVGESLNLGVGQGFSVRQVIDAASRVLGRPVPLVEKPERPGDPPSLVADATRAMQRLGWSPKYTTIDSIIDSAWQWYQRQGFAPSQD